MHHGACILRDVGARVLVHQAGQQILVQRTPVDANADRLLPAKGRVDDGGELAVLLVLEADVAGIDPILVERLGGGRIVGKQRMAVIVKVANEGDVNTALQEPFADVRYSLGGLVAVDGDAYKLGAGAREGCDLGRGGVYVGGVGVGHRLDDDGCTAADEHTCDANLMGSAPGSDEIGG